MGAIQYVVKQDTRSTGTGLYYGRAVHPSTVTLETIAERIQRNCSMTKADVLAVLTEMVSVMTDELQNSNKVKLDGLGTFYIGLRTTGANTVEEFNANEHVQGFNVKFLAQAKKQNGVYVRTFTDGLKAQKASGAE